MEDREAVRRLRLLADLRPQIRCTVPEIARGGPMYIRGVCAPHGRCGPGERCAGRANTGRIRGQANTGTGAPFPTP